MGLFSERNDLIKQLNTAETRLESVKAERNILAGRVRTLEREGQFLAQRERKLREALEFLVNNCNADRTAKRIAQSDDPWGTALEMARAVLSEGEPEG